MTRIRFSLPALVFAAACGTCWAQQPSGPAPSSAPTWDVGRIAPETLLPATIPFTFSDGLIIVKAALGDGTEQRAAVATALPLCIVQPELAQTQSLKVFGSRDVPTLYGPLAVQDAGKQRLTLFQVVANDVPCGVCDLYAGLSSKKSVGKPMIWLGYSFWGAAQITIDPAQHQLTFRKAGTPLPKKAFIIPFDLNDGRIEVQVKANGRKPIAALVDTTAVGTLLPAAEGRALRLPSVAVYTASHPNGKKGKVTAIDLKELSIGSAKVNQVPALFVSEGDADGLDVGPAIVGTDVLLRFRVTIDYSMKKMALEAIQRPQESVVTSGEPPTRPRPGVVEPRFIPRPRP
ncbi:MAG: retroviral-like aspartic protease family protein [Chthonomonadales bacterium]